MDLNGMVRSISKYRVNDVISQKDGDQGDSLNRTGVYYSCLAALGVQSDDLTIPLSSALSVSAYKLVAGPGRYRRGNALAADGTPRWFNNPDNVTRDQMVTLEAAMALNADVLNARAHFWKRAKRLFFHFSTQNDGADAGPLKHKLPDLCTPSEFGTLIRATRYKFLYFLLPLTDLFLLIDVKFSRSLNERSLYDADNQLLPQVLAALDQPSFVTEYVRKAYAQTDAAQRLRSYYSEANNRNGIEPLGEIAALAFERCIGGLNT